MAYTKTPWANSPAITSPINADNLNKIEDGLFDQDARITVVETEASGWTVLPATLTHASATTMNTSVDLTGILQVGDKIKLTQTNAKYFYVIAITSNLITVTGGSDYTVANDTITSPYYSHQLSPLGFPNAFNYTPILTILDGGTIPTYSTINGKFQIVGKRVMGNIYFNNFSGGTAGSGANSIVITMPVIPNYTNPADWAGNIIGTYKLYNESGTIDVGNLTSLNNNINCALSKPNSASYMSANDQSSANRHIAGTLNYFIA